MTEEEARKLAQHFGVRMCDENGDTHGEELYCFGLDDIISIRKSLAEKSSGTEHPVPPPECKTEAEKTAFAFGWFKALEAQREQPAIKQDLTPEQPAQQQEPVAFLANGTRFKMSFFDSEVDGCGNTGTYVTCFEAFEKELDGRWVALVAAEDNCHLKTTSPPPSKPWVGLTDAEMYVLSDDVARRGVPVFEAICEAEAKLKERNA